MAWLAPSASFEYLCYSILSEADLLFSHNSLLLARGSLDVIYLNEIITIRGSYGMPLRDSVTAATSTDVDQILTYKVDPRAKRTKIFYNGRRLIT